MSSDRKGFVCSMKSSCTLVRLCSLHGRACAVLVRDDCVGFTAVGEQSRASARLQMRSVLSHLEKEHGSHQTCALMRLAIWKVPLVMVGADAASIIYFTSDWKASRKFINVCKWSQLQLSSYLDSEEIKTSALSESPVHHKLDFAFKPIKPHLHIPN